MPIADAAVSSSLPPYAVANLPTPVLYTADFGSVFGGSDGATLKLDDYEQIDDLEFIALPRTVFRILGSEQHGGHAYYQVATKDYPTPEGRSLYIDARFVTTKNHEPPERERLLPQKRTILHRLKTAEGDPYIWGGNYHAGVPVLASFYPPTVPLSALLRAKWTLAGVDCSGLLYEATNGVTPRNTRELVSYGTAVPIAGKTASEIAALLKPLDIIAWAGHTIIVLDATHTIESRVDYEPDTPGFQGGVRIRDLISVVEETLAKRTAVDDYSVDAGEGVKKFVVRRWYPDLPKGS